MCCPSRHTRHSAGSTRACSSPGTHQARALLTQGTPHPHPKDLPLTWDPGRPLQVPGLLWTQTVLGLLPGLSEVYVWMPGSLGSATGLPVGLDSSTWRTCWLSLSSSRKKTRAAGHCVVAAGSAQGVTLGSGGCQEKGKAPRQVVTCRAGHLRPAE